MPLPSALPRSRVKPNPVPATEGNTVVTMTSNPGDRVVTFGSFGDMPREGTIGHPAMGTFHPKTAQKPMIINPMLTLLPPGTLGGAIAPDMSWNEELFPEAGCFGADGIVNGYQASFTLDLSQLLTHAGLSI